MTGLVVYLYYRHETLVASGASMGLCRPVFTYAPAVYIVFSSAGVFPPSPLAVPVGEKAMYTAGAYVDTYVYSPGKLKKKQ